MKQPHRFADLGLLERALTHPSAAFEAGAAVNNQREEFLGDAVLELVVTEWLLTAQPDWPEGQLSRARAKLVNAAQLAAFADAWELGPSIRLSKGARSEGLARNENVRADAFEAVVAAIYRDAGIEAVRAAVLPLVEAAFARLDGVIDPRSELMEWLQARGEREPEYVVEAQHGPAHQAVFSMTVRVNGVSYGPAQGASKRKAAAEAARIALLALRSR